jgi:hypothetical protein
MKRRGLVVVVLGAAAVVAVGLARKARADREGSATAGPPEGPGPLGVVEVESEEVDDDGNLVVDDLLVAVDDEGTIVATDETVAVITPEGDAVVDERLSVIGTDGKLHTIGEDLTVTETADED